MKAKNNIGCHEKDCNNKFYKMDKISPVMEVPCCKKHYLMYALGHSEYGASRGKREVSKR